MRKLAPSKIDRRYGWHKPPLPNMLKRPVFKAPEIIELPSSVSLLELQPEPFDQGQEGSCTANSACGEARYLHRLLGIDPDADFSRQLLYYLERQDQGSGPTEDSGSSIAESVAAMERYGLALEKDWPYEGNFSTAPTEAILEEAAQHKILSASLVDNDPIAFKTCLFQKRGVMIGFTVFESFESQETAQSGFMRMPSDVEQILGGHAVRIIGYDDELTHTYPSHSLFGHEVTLKGFYRVRNSWGNWGFEGSGDFMMPYDFVHNQQYASDFHRLDQAS